MKILGIDSSGMVASVAIVSEDILIGEYTLNLKKTHSETLLPMLDQLLKSLNIDINEIEGIAVASGPGSFTGLRIGAATVKGLGIALNKKIIPVETCKALANNIFSPDSLICPIMDARRKQVYTGIFKNNGEEIKTIIEQKAVDIEEIINEINILNKNVIFLGDATLVYSDEIKEKVKVDYSIAPVHLSQQRASSVAELGLRALLKGEYCDSDKFNLIYLRKPQAQREKEEKEEKEYELKENIVIDNFQNTKKEVLIKEINADMILDLIKIEESIFENEKWSIESLTDCIKKDHNSGIFIYLEQELVGFIIYSIVIDECEILKIGILEKYQRLGLGKKLLEEFMKKADVNGAKKIFLEVRENNGAAQGLYKKCGFSKIGIRKNYYKNPDEDGIIFSLEL